MKGVLPAARCAQIQENRSILDSVTDEVGRLKSRLHSKDRARLVEYLDAIPHTERRIQLAEEQASRELPTLSKPGGSIPASFDDYAKLMFDLQLLAWMCAVSKSTPAISTEYGGRAPDPVRSATTK